jgi:hypothetical protein
LPWGGCALLICGRTVLAYFVLTFSSLAREGLGPRRGKAELLRVHVRQALQPALTNSQPFSSDHVEQAFPPAVFGVAPSPPCGAGLPPALANQRFELQLLYDSATQTISNSAEPLTLDLTPSAEPTDRIRIAFLTPTELKHEHKIARRPEFPILFSRIRDRVATLSRLYAGVTLDIDYLGTNARAAEVKMTACRGRHSETERRSTKTGQSHSLGGFTGEAEYEGSLAEFLPFLEAARWTGVGRQSVWGKGEISVERLSPALS